MTTWACQTTGVDCANYLGWFWSFCEGLYEAKRCIWDASVLGSFWFPLFCFYFCFDGLNGKNEGRNSTQNMGK